MEANDLMGEMNRCLCRCICAFMCAIFRRKRWSVFGLNCANVLWLFCMATLRLKLCLLWINRHAILD